MKNLILLLFISTAIFSLSLIDDDYASRIKVFDEYPVPSDENMLFYIQKSYNTNTVVYAANIDADGKLNAKEPVLVFWRRYQENGQKRELKIIERTFGYGVNSKPIKDRSNSYSFTLVSLKDMSFIITLDKKGKPQVATIIDKKSAQIERVFVTAEHINILPKVFSVEVFGKEIKTHQPLYQKFTNKEKP
ncbi:MAG: hypothetical protein COW67_11120 [Flavobacteriales bacterium CG18_big_fil_WC_8_21_14_2_50_32_9]|nr:MAG: hypothetical protein COW67_11120 [Flavobacteriales bacterium CG18_big_fil_WC_8_21_14_2_50_32_9]PJC61981.1 MAG: hypothetical protein CO022_06960 [Flavobacteriales bacterium CG_4_9_14_0_2_um_filter_32_27]